MARLVPKALVDDLTKQLYKALDDKNEDEIFILTHQVVSYTYERLFHSRIQEYRILEIDSAKCLSEENVRHCERWLQRLNNETLQGWDQEFDEWLALIRE